MTPASRGETAGGPARRLRGGCRGALRAGAVRLPHDALDGTITRANVTFLGWTGLTRPRSSAGASSTLLTGGGRIYHETHYAPLLVLQGSVREVAFEIVCADGTRLPVLVNATLERERGGRAAADPRRGVRREPPPRVRAQPAARTRRRARRPRAHRAPAGRQPGARRDARPAAIGAAVLDAVGLDRDLRPGAHAAGRPRRQRRRRPPSWTACRAGAGAGAARRAGARGAARGALAHERSRRGACSRRASSRACPRRRGGMALRSSSASRRGASSPRCASVAASRRRSATTSVRS